MYFIHTAIPLKLSLENIMTGAFGLILLDKDWEWASSFIKERIEADCCLNPMQSKNASVERTS